MRPYTHTGKLLNSLVFLFICSNLHSAVSGVISPPGGDNKVNSPTIHGTRLVNVDPLAKKAIVCLYNLEYDKAIASWEQLSQAHPRDLPVQNHLLQAVVLKELYRLNALDTTLYTDNGFLTGKPLPGDPIIRARIQALAEANIALAEQRLQADPNDVDALYARGVTKGLRLVYVGIVEKGFFAALKNAIASRNDHERVLQIDPAYADAKLIVGVHNFVLGSLPFGMRLLVGMAGIGGNKKKGLELLSELGATSAETSTDARAALALFLRREARYADALKVAHDLSVQYPKNFIFALEEANLLKDAGRGADAIEAYNRVLANGKAGLYADPHLERAVYGLAESLKGQRKTQLALQAYQSALGYANLAPDVKLRALLGAGQMHDVLAQREAAMKSYQAVNLLQPDSAHAEEARKHLKRPYRFPQ